MQVDVAGEEHADIVVETVIPLEPSDADATFGPWLKPRSRHGSIWGRGDSHRGSRGSNRSLPVDDKPLGIDGLDPDAWPPT